jgi:two-component system, LuxR family, response regulator FixJ
MGKAEDWVYLVEDDAAARLWLGMELEGLGFAVRSFASAGEFLEAAPSLPCGCILSDLRMPEIDGIGLLDRLAARGLRFPVVMVTAYGNVAAAVQAMKAGAVGFVEKPISDAEILENIREAHKRLTEIAEQELAGVARQRLLRLTEREREVLERLVVGLPNKGIAAALGISSRTVEAHRRSVMEKMEADNLARLVRLAIAGGLDPGRLPQRH